MLDLQTHAIFPAHAVANPGPLPRGAKRLSLPTKDGETLHGVHVPGRAAPGKPRTLILGFGGNAWNGDDAATFLHGQFPASDVVVFHYRGYHPSTGSPSARALLADAPLVHDYAVAQTKPDKTVVVGFSIGSGIGAVLSTKREVDGLILVTPFDSLKAVAADMYPMLPVGLLFSHEIDAARAIAGTRTPVAIIAAAEDGLIRKPRTDGLREAVPNLVLDKTIPRVGHNDIYYAPAFRVAMRDALAVVTAGKSAGA